MTGLRAQTLVWCALVLLIAAGVPARKPSPVVGLQETLPDNLRECPHELDRKYDEVAVAGLTEVGAIRDVPEYHDCQRFIVMDRGNLRYDSLFAIYVSFRQDSIGQRLTVLERRYFRERQQVAVTAAQIVAYGDYALLGLRKGVNCLYMYRDRSVGRPWRAKMIPPGAGVDCRNEINPDVVPGTALSVQWTRWDPSETFAHDDIPPVARWEWDAKNNKQYIGIKCEAAWCEVFGGGTVDAAPPHRAAPALPKKFRRTRRVKGWYDEQVLATVPAAGARPQPTTVTGTIFPDSALPERTIAHFSAQWTPVAHVALSAALPEYKRKFNFDPAPPAGGSLNTISLCYGSKRECVGYGLSWIRYWFGIRLSTPNCSQGWWAKIDPAMGGAPMYKCIARYPGVTDLEPVPVPGTARWRWLADDEGTWERCDQGCCELKGKA